MAIFMVHDGSYVLAVSLLKAQVMELFQAGACSSAPDHRPRSSDIADQKLVRGRNFHTHTCFGMQTETLLVYVTELAPETLRTIGM